MTQKKYPQTIVFVLLVGMLANSSLAADKVVVIPLFSQAKAVVAPVAKTGQTATKPFAVPAGADGNLEKGIAWPNPRFSDNSDGTVTDNLTGLIWLANAKCIDTVDGVNKSDGDLLWADALKWSNGLADGDCSLTDSSVAGDWRLPNIHELESLRAMQYHDPALSNDVGTGQWKDDATSTFYGEMHRTFWSSTTFAGNVNEACYVNFYYGYVDASNKVTIRNHVWPVRD